MAKLDKSKPYDEVIGAGAPYRYHQDGKYFKPCGRQCSKDGVILKKTSEENMTELANKVRNEEVDPLVLPSRFDAKPKSLRKRDGEIK